MEEYTVVLISPAQQSTIRDLDDLAAVREFVRAEKSSLYEEVLMMWNGEEIARSKGGHLTVHIDRPDISDLIKLEKIRKTP